MYYTILQKGGKKMNIKHKIVEKNHIHTIKLRNNEELQLNMIIDWLSDLPFREEKKITVTEAIRICINHFYHNVAFEEKI